MKMSKEDMEEYLTIQDSDDDRMIAIKEEIRSWSASAKIIWFTYIELGSYAATAREFSVSAPTAKTYVVALRDRIKNRIKGVE